MRETMDRSLAPGTIRNRLNQAKIYIKFMLSYGFDYMNPGIMELTMFAQFLSNSFAAPTTVKNHMSGAKNWVQLHCGHIENFGAQELAMMSKSILEKSAHVPSPASPITSEDMKVICAYIDSLKNPHPAYKAAILLAFSTFLRVSNVLSQSLSAWGGEHTLQASNIRINGDSLLVTIRSTKTRRHGAPHFLQVFPAHNIRTCPVQAWTAYVRTVRPCPLGPAFMLDDHTPLTPGPVVNLMRKAITKNGQIRKGRISFHSLRRGGAQTAVNNGATKLQIMNHGTWKSTSGVEAYIKPDSRIVPAILAGTLADNARS